MVSRGRELTNKAAAKSAVTKFAEKFGKTFGEGTLVRTADIIPYEIISTGSLTVDNALGVGGFVEGRLVEFWGIDGVGKTTFALMTLAEAQKKHPDKQVGWIDMEQKLDLAWASSHGVDLTMMMRYKPESAEDVADALKEMVRSGLFSVIVLDSIGGMLPEKQMEKDADEATMGDQAKIVTRMVKIAAVEAMRTGTSVIFINQVRANLGYGADTTTGGGFALKHATTHKLKFKRTGTPPHKAKIDGADIPVGHEIAIVIERNGVSPAYKTAIVSIFNQPTAKYGPLGVDRADEAVEMGLKYKVIDKSGHFYTLPVTGERLPSRADTVTALRQQPNVIEEIRKQVLAATASEVYDEEHTEAALEGNKFRTGVDDGD